MTEKPTFKPKNPTSTSGKPVSVKPAPKAAPKATATAKPKAKGKESKTEENKNNLVLKLQQVSAWDAAKVAFPALVCIHLILLVAFAVVYALFSFSGVISGVSDFIGKAGFSTDEFDFASLLGFGKIFAVLLGFSIISSVVGTFLTMIVIKIFNISIKFSGGIRVTLGQD
jgi:hypothetical protein